MIALVGRSCVVLCLALLAGTRADVKVDNKAYQNVVVSFSSKIVTDDGKDLIDSMKELLKETSSVLETAIGLRIGSVIFNLPKTWNSSTWEGINPAPLSSSDLLPNLRVEAVPDSAFGQQPFALQYSGCGVPGLDITIPDDFLAAYRQEGGYPKGKLLAREWLKYRYGVFDENGFQNDTAYPPHFIVAGSDEVRVTDCTFPEVHYDFRDSKGDNCSLTSDDQSDCHSHPLEESTENVTSSIMFFHKDLPKVEHICGKDEYLHNTESPNKHNLICAYKSISEVIQASPDFKKDQVPGDIEEIQFSYVQESRPRVVIAWQNTKSLKKQEKALLNAIGKFLFDLPDYSKYAVFPFRNQPYQIKDLTELTPGTSRDVTLSSTFSSSDQDICISCAVNAAADALLAENKDLKGTILIIAASNPSEDSALVEKLRNSNLCLVVVVFAEASKDNWNTLIEASKCSSIVEIKDADEDTVFIQLYKVMDSILPLTTDDRRTSTVITDWLSATSTIAIPENSEAEIYTLWIFEIIEEEDIKCVIGEEKIEWSHKRETHKIMIFEFTAQNGEVKCSLEESSSARLLTQVRMTSKKGAYFSSELWIHDTTPEGSTEQMPVIIYAKINFGEYPVRDADVKAVVLFPKESGEESAKSEIIPLFDDGRGDPDITRHDGIYSRYFTHFDVEGDYRVFLTANDNKKQAKFGKNGQAPCCGSTVISEPFDASSFQLTSEARFGAISKRPEQGYKPSRVVDLKVDTEFLPNSITLKWTAPGGEADDGKAHSYIIKSFTSREDAIQKFDYNDTGKLIDVTLTPKTFKESEVFAFDLDEFDDNATYYFALRSTNEANQTSDTSNIVVLVILHGAKTMTVGESTTHTPPKDEKTGSMDRKTVGLIVGICLLAIIVIGIVFVIVYVVVVKPNRKKAKQEARRNDNPNQRSNTGPFASISIPADVILKHHNEVVTAKNAHKDPPIFTEENLETAQNQRNSSENVSKNDNADYSIPDRKQMSTFQENPPKSPKRITPV